MKKLKKTKKINLLPKEGLSSSTSGRILLWALSTFRILLIITEVFVIGAFISRFWLDAKNTDLTEEMKEAKSVIASYQSFENEFKDLQKRLDLFNSYKLDLSKMTDNVKILNQRRPDGIYFNTLDSDNDRIFITLTSANEIVLQQYLVNLKSEDIFQNVNVNAIALDKDGISLKSTITIKTGNNI